MSSPASLEMSGLPSMAAGVLADIWRAIGTELVIFTATFVAALALRRFTEISQPKRPANKEVPKVPVLPSPQRRPAVERRVPPAAAATVSPQSLAGVLDHIVDSMRDQVSLRVAGRAILQYNEELRVRFKSEGLRIQEVARYSQRSALDMYATLVHCAIRAGRHHLVEALIDDMAEQGVQRTLNFYESAMKQLAGQRQFHLALAVYDRLASDGLKPSAVTCSCLIGFATEVGELERAVEFFQMLSELTTPTIRAYMSVLRVHARRQDFAASVAILRDMERRKVGMDSLALNVALATGVATDQLDAVEQLVAEASSKQPPVCDVVSFNTLIKGFAHRCNFDSAARVIAQMRRLGVSPNAISFNTAMDAAVRSGRGAEAWRLLGELRESGLQPDKFTCSILVKSLAKGATEPQVLRILALLREVDHLCDNMLKPSLYNTVFEVAVGIGGATSGPALGAKVFGQMRHFKVQPTPSAQRLMVKSLPGVSAEASSATGG
mmetsp:Transcript_122015/g.352539  ORF Transcript_122015/g.352539 Transcript_122015/m.352539 type:complete len:494 (-) Transcript_122015:101-1582(-)